MCYAPSAGISQNDGVEPLGKLVNKMSPVNKELFVPPKVRIPPETISLGFPLLMFLLQTVEKAGYN